MGLLKKIDDLSTAPALSVDWSPGNAETALQTVLDPVTTLANDAITWYVDAKNDKRFYARSIRILAIVLGAIAALLPTVSEIVTSGIST